MERGASVELRIKHKNMDKIKKTLIIVLATLAVIMIILMVVAKVISSRSDQAEKTSNSQNSSSSDKKVFTEEDLKKVIQGRISDLTESSLVITDKLDQKTRLFIPQKNVKFFKEIETNQDSLTLKEIGLFEIEEDSQVEAVYDFRTRMVSFLKVVEE